METESDSDEESQMTEIHQLTAVLEADTRVSCDYQSSQYSPTCSTTSLDDQDTNLDISIGFNKLIDEKYQKLDKILNDRLRECRQKLQEISSLPTPSEKQDKMFRYIVCGRPYFKDKNNFPSPDNEDTICMARLNIFDFSVVSSVPGWTVSDKSEFLSLIHIMSIEIKKHELNSQIAQLQREKKVKDNKNVDKEIENIKQQIDGLKKKTLSELALPIHEEYDWDTISNKTNFRHNPQEYRALWRLFLHPSINKSTWSRNEHIKLQKIAHACNLQDWDTIAHTLDTERTGYQCFVYYRTNVSTILSGQKWSKEEEEYLKRLIDFYKEDNYIPWSKVASSMENRTKIQIYNKFFRLVEQRKGRFLPEEDAVILTGINNFGTNFRRISKYLPGRSMAQLRARYHVLVTAKRTSIVWTIDDDKKLIQFMANQDPSVNYSSLTKHFPGKSRAHIRTRYMTLLKWMRKHPNIDISKAPRRGARRLRHGKESQDLNIAVENLKKRIQTEVETKKNKRLSIDSSEDDIENAIIATLINEGLSAEELDKPEISDSERAFMTDTPTVSQNVTNLHKLLLFLNAKLNKDIFKSSHYYKKYPDLTNLEQESCLLIKSYSKKDTVQVVKIDETPDIWGNKILGDIEYVLPPNLATITGCRQLMSYVTTAPPVENANLTLSMITRRNVLVKEQLRILMERFHTLFLWPMLLSNENPKSQATKNTEKSTKKVRTVRQTGDPGVTVRPNEKEPRVNESIDLDESDIKSDINIEKLYVGSDDFMYLEY